jgi:hypothetical protein
MLPLLLFVYTSKAKIPSATHITFLHADSDASVVHGIMRLYATRVNHAVVLSHVFSQRA